MTTFGIFFCVIKSAILSIFRESKNGLLFAVAGTNIVPVEDDSCTYCLFMSDILNDILLAAILI